MIPRAQADFAVPRTQPQVGGEAQAFSSVLTGAKQGFQLVRDQAQQKLQKRQQADDAAGLIDFENQYKLATQEIERVTSETVPKNGDGYLATVREARLKARDELISKVPSYVSEDGKLAINQLASRLDGESDLRATEFQDNAATAWVMDSLDQSVQADIATVLSDPTSISQATQRALTRLNAMSGRMTPDQEVAMRDQIERDMSIAQVTGFARAGDFKAAQNAADAMAPLLSLEEQFGLETSIAREIRARDQRIEEARRELSDQASIDLAQKFITGTLSEKDILNAASDLGSGAEVRTWYTALDTKRRRDEERVKDALDDQKRFVSVFSEAALISEIEQGASMFDVLQGAFNAYASNSLTDQGIRRILGAKETVDDERYGAYANLVEAPFRQGGIFAQFDETKEVAKAQAKLAFLQAWPSLKDSSEAEINAAIENITARAGKDMKAALPALPLPSSFSAAPTSVDQIESEMQDIRQIYQAKTALGQDTSLERQDIERLMDWRDKLQVTDNGK